MSYTIACTSRIVAVLGLLALHPPPAVSGVDSVLGRSTPDYVHVGGPSPPAPAPPPGQWSAEKNLTFCNGKVLNDTETPTMSVAECKAECAADPECFFINHSELTPGQCQTLGSCTATACEASDAAHPDTQWWSVYAYGRTGAPPYPGCAAPPSKPIPGACPQYHSFPTKIDPAGPLQTEDGTWHVFSCCSWAHCTASDLIHWNCSHPDTGLSGNTGSISVTPHGTVAIWANNTDVLIATPNATDLDRWTQKGVAAHKLPGFGALSDVGRALQLDSGWYVPVGVTGPPGAGGGIHWYRGSGADGAGMSTLTHAGWLFTIKSQTQDPDGEISCPDVFKLGDKVVILPRFGHIACVLQSFCCGSGSPLRDCL